VQYSSRAQKRHLLDFITTPPKLDCGAIGHDPEFIQITTIKERPVLLDVLMLLIDTPHILGKVRGQVKEMYR